MSTTRRSLLTAAAAGALLGALSFVPSANATVTPERAEPRSAEAVAVSAVAAADGHSPSTSSSGSSDASGPRTMSVASGTTSNPGSGPDSGPTTADAVPATAVDTELADTGAFDTTPYILGGTAFLGMGAAFVAYSVRRERMGF